jgi:membrane fusion protein, multidrug efflux system
LDFKEADMSTATTMDEAPNTTSSEGKKDAPPKTRISRKLLLFVVLAVLLVAGLCYWLYARHYESTDDAQVDGHFAQLSTRVTGTVTYVNPLVENDRYVTAGMLLLELDPRDYQADLEHATATLETKEAAANAAKLQVPITQASAFSQLHLSEAAREQAIESVAAAEADLTAAQARVQQDEAVAGRAERDRVRYAALVEKREISRSFYDARMTDAAATAQTLASDIAAVKAAQQRIAEAKSLVTERAAQVASARTAPQQYSDAVAHESSAQGELDQARADVHTAELNLSYTKIYAPVSGVVGHKTVELGHRIQPGQSLLTVVPLDDIWITANFKETQLRHMHPGQPVTIHVDTFGHDYKGTVEDMAGAAGPLFSLFPPENASGNYVKIVQRFPIRIRIHKGEDPNHDLRPGMSVEATVKVR